VHGPSRARAVQPALTTYAAPPSAPASPPCCRAGATAPPAQSGRLYCRTMG